MSQSMNTVESGSLLSIQPSEPCVVYIDDIEVGSSPLFLTNISEKNRRIKLKGDNTYFETEIIFNNEKRNVSYFSPMLIPYYGYINFSESTSENSKLYIDGERVYSIELEPVKLTSGNHKIKFEKEGFFPLEESIYVTKLETSNVELMVLKSIPVKLNTKVPNESVVTFSNDDGTVLNFYEEVIYLYEGDWTLNIKNYLFKEIDMNFTIQHEPVVLDISIEYYQPKVNLDGLLVKSSIFLNNIDVTKDVVGSKLEIPVGEHKLSIQRDKYLPIAVDFSVEGDDVFELILDYKKDPIVQRRSGFITAGTFLGSGLALLVSGLIMNSDNFILDNTSDYEGYKNMKNTTLGAAGVGLILSLTGSGIGIFSFMIPLDGE